MVPGAPGFVLGGLWCARSAWHGGNSEFGGGLGAQPPEKSRGREAILAIRNIKIDMKLK